MQTNGDLVQATVVQCNIIVDTRGRSLNTRILLLQLMMMMMMLMVMISAGLTIAIYCMVRKVHVWMMKKASLADIR